MSLGFRNATRQDIPVILQMIRELAAYEKLLHEVVATEEILKESLFGKHSRAFAIIAEHEGIPIGFALYFYNFSTFLGKPGLYIEDIYIRPEYRGRGYGKRFMSHLANIAVAEGCGRMEWWVLDWNTPSIEFYRSIGAEPMEEWTVQRLTGKALEALAKPSG